MKTKKQFEDLGFTFITLGGGAISASKLFRNEEGEICRIGANAKTLPTLRKRLETIVMENPNIFK